MHHTPKTLAPAGRRRRPAAFTLVEVMVALGILAIALPMVAAALLSGMLENQESVENTMSTMLGENALAVLRCRVKHSDLVAAWGADAMGAPLVVPAGLIAEVERVYDPFPEDNKPTPFAYVILGQRLAGGENDYRFVVLLYRKLGSADTFSSAKVTLVNSAGSAGHLTVDEDINNTYVELGSGANQHKSKPLSHYVMRLSLKP